MKNSKRAFVLTEVALGIMVVIMTFIMIQGRNAKDTDKVSVIIPNSDDNEWSAFRYGLRMAAQDQNIEIIVAGTGELGIEEEEETIEREIDNGARAVIVQPSSGRGTEKMLKQIEKKIPVMLVGEKETEDGTALEIPFTEPDNYGIGEALAQELLKDYNGKIKGKKIGIVSETGDFGTAADRRAGLENALAGMGTEILWSVSDLHGKEKGEILKSQLAADIIIAFDDSSLILAGECAQANDLHGALVYGIGNSTEAAYYLDVGAVQCLAVPDEFSVGYQSLTQIAKKLRQRAYELESQKVPYKVIRREALFSEENQKILFTMSQ